MSSGWIDLQAEKGPRPTSSVVLDMSTGQPSIPTRGIMSDTLATNSVLFDASNW